MIITDIRINNLLWSDLPNVCGKSVYVKFLTSTVYTVNPQIYIRGGHFILSNKYTFFLEEWEL